MSQFTVHQNANPDTATTFPYLLDIPSNLLETLATRVVAPLSPANAWEGKAIRKLMPILDVNGEAFVMLTSQLAGVHKRALGKQVANLQESRAESIAAVDFVLLGF